MVRRRNKYKRDNYGHIEGEIDYQDENMKETEEIDIGKNNEGKREGESTKDWIIEAEIIQSNQVTQVRGEGKEKGEEAQMEEERYNEINESAIVVAKVNDEEILPLAFQMDDEKRREERKMYLKQSLGKNMEEVDKDDLSQKISRVGKSKENIPNKGIKVKKILQRLKHHPDNRREQLSKILNINEGFIMEY
ncbi:hypothetical protein H5410_022114 [Solanum commersonii]|uniref:Uncharacterized protein n=1 Tax=Solanum commersonii TaxID=4109 RepID=A0A9J5ZD97_SOLCO|nr:hypothetical protein H5410_022114 [Solanum commersonii]